MDVKLVSSHRENEASCRVVKEPVHETHPVLRRISGDASEEQRPSASVLCFRASLKTLRRTPCYAGRRYNDLAILTKKIGYFSVTGRNLWEKEVLGGTFLSLEIELK